MRQRRDIRIFLSSPSDVQSERDAARKVISKLSFDPALRNRATFQLFSWDDPDAPPAFPASLPPQAAVDRGLPKPSECDVVLIVLWARMGTLLSAEYVKPNGERYFSGTEWEYEQAMAAAKASGKPTVLLYRRTADPQIELLDPDHSEKRRQLLMVDQLVQRLTNSDGSLAGGRHEYKDAGDFPELMDKTLREVFERLLKASSPVTRVEELRRVLDRFGREKESASFAGRSDVLEALDGWLAGTDTPANLLLCAPGGRGKSTLLVQWLAALKQRGELPSSIVFLPISRRHELAKDFDFFPALAASLAPFLSDAEPFPDDVGEMRGFAQRALGAAAEAGNPLLVVIDGLDEADGWNIGPAFLPERPPGHAVRILISARTAADDPSGQHWARQLGWDRNALTLHLEQLSPDAVREVLRSAGNSLQTDILEHLVTLCEGDPLVTQIVAQQIRDHELADLARIGQGIGDPLRRILQEWYERALAAASEAVKPTLYNLVGVLASARGPLTRADLSVVLGISSGQLDAALQPVRTLIVGNVADGYGFSHPRMAEALAAVLAADTRDVRHGFVRLIEAALDASVARPSETSQYALRHAADHIVDATDAPQLMQALLSPGWLKAHRDSFGHARGFIEMAESAADYARTANARAAATGRVPPCSALEFLAVLWRTIAGECMTLQLRREPDAAENPLLLLERVREALAPPVSSGHFPPPPTFSGPVSELKTLLELRDRLHRDLLPDWEELTAKAANAVSEGLFSGWPDDRDEAVRLLRQVRPDVDLEAIADAIGSPEKQLAARQYLVERGLIEDRADQLERIKALSDSVSSLKLKAEAAVWLAGVQAITFEDAFKMLLSFARTDYNSSQSAAEMAVTLLDSSRPRHYGLAELSGLFDRFLSAISEPGDAAPLLGALLRHCPRHERPHLWPEVLRLAYWENIGTAVEYGPADWTEGEIDDFVQLIGGRVTAPDESDRVEAPPEGDARSAWRQARNVASVISEIARRSDGAARRLALTRVLDNLEVIPGQGWWREPAEVLADILPMMQHDPASTERIRLRADALVQAYEASKDEPISGSRLSWGIYDLPPAQAAREIITFINRWQKRGLEWARGAIRGRAQHHAVALANMLPEISDMGLRQQVARLLLESEALDRATAEAVAREVGVPDPGLHKHRARHSRDRELIIYLIDALDIPGTDTTTTTLHWLLDAGADALGSLSRVTIPSEWTMPPDLVRRLTPILRSWLDTRGGWFPTALATRLPQAQLTEVLGQLLEADDENLTAIAREILRAVTDPAVASELERAYLSAVGARPSEFGARFWVVHSAPNYLPSIHHPDEWLSCRVAQLQRDDELDPPGIVEQIAFDASRLRHENLRRSFAQWALDRLDAVSDPVRRATIRHELGSAPKLDELERVDAVSDPVRRAVIRHQLGITPKPDELEACRALLERATVDEGKEQSAISTLPIFAATGPDAQTRQLIDAFVAGTGRDGYYSAISALGPAATVDNVRSTLHHALYWVTYTGSPTPPEDYFLRLPDRDRDAAFRAHVDALDKLEEVEGRRRFIEKVASVATSAFASEILRDLLRPDADQAFWRTAIGRLISRLAPDDAAAFIGPVLDITKANDDAGFAQALIARMRPRERAAFLARTLTALGRSSARSAQLEFCRKFPDLLDGGAIEEALRSAEIDNGFDLSWIAEAPAASLKQRDRALGIVLKRARGGSASFEYAAGALAEVLRLRHAWGSTDADIVDSVRSAISALEEELGH